MLPKRSLRPARQQLPPAGLLRGPLGRFCAASKALLDAVHSGKGAHDEAYFNGILDMLTELEPTAGALDDKGRSALFVAVLQSISAALRWPAPRTATERRTEMLVKQLCVAAMRCAMGVVDYDINGAFLQSRQHRDDAVKFASALLESNALHSFAQKVAEASAAALDELLPCQRNPQRQQQQQKDRPAGREQQQKSAAAAGAAAVGRSKQEQGAASGSSSSGGEGLNQARARLEQWLPVLDELGTPVHIIARHDPYSPASGNRPGLAVAASLETGRPPPMQSLFAAAIASSGVLEHAAKAMATLALMSGTMPQQGSGRQAGGSDAGGGTSRSTFSSWTIESCASFMQLVGVAPEPAHETPATTSGNQHNCGGSKAARTPAPPAGPSSASPSSAAQGSGLPAAIQQPHLQNPFGPWSRYVLTCLGLRCLHDLDGGSCYGMPPELVRGLPTMVAPLTFTYDRDKDEVQRVALTPAQEAMCRIQVLASMVRLLGPVRRQGGGNSGRTARVYGAGARATEVYGGNGRSADALSGCAGVAEIGETAGPGQGGGGHGGREVWWPGAGPKAARDISRRVVGWAVGVARGWVAEEERKRRAGGGAGSGGGHNPSLGMMGARSQPSSEKDTLALAKDAVGPLVLQALSAYLRTMGEAGAGTGAAAAAGDGGKGGAGEEGCSAGGKRRQGLGRKQQQQVLLAEWYGLACGAVQYAMRWPTVGDVGGDLAELMALGLPQLTHTDRLPPLPPPRLAAALSGGYLPCLDTLLRRCGRGCVHGDVVMVGHLIINGGSLKALFRLLSSPGGGSSCSNSIVIDFAHDLPWLLAYGNPRQSASLLASMAKVLRRAARDRSRDVPAGWRGFSFAAPGTGPPGNEVEEMVAEGLAFMLCRNLGAAFTWMQEAHGRRYGHPSNRSAAGGSAAHARDSSGAAAGGSPTANGSTGAGDAAAGFPKGPERLQLLLSFALARVVPSLTAHFIRQCRELPLLVDTRASAGGGRSLCQGDDDPQTLLARSLQQLLSVLLMAQKTVWRCRDLVNKARGTGAGHGSGAGGSGGGSSSSTSSGLGPLADGLQRLLDGEADMAGLVGAALDCLQLLPASERGRVAATALELSHCSLFSCALDLVQRGPPAALVTWDAASPSYKRVLSAGPEKLRAAVSAARAGGYSAGAKAGELLLQIMTASQPGAVVHPAPEVPLWLLGPGEVVRELGGSCCCNARCTRLEGDSEAGEGQGQGLLVCGRCRGAWYCCRECQAADWGAGHKKACKGK